MIYHKGKTPLRLRIAAWLASPTHHIVRNKERKEKTELPLLKEVKNDE